MRIFLGNKVHPGTTGLHIQARPASWLADFGSVPILKPTEAMVPLVMALVQDRKDKKPVDMRKVGDYHFAYDAHLRGKDLRPGKLLNHIGKPVGPDHTLICTCSREESAAGRCHRVWATFWLEEAGWEVYGDWMETK
jgi:hypothetical protein